MIGPNDPWFIHQTLLFSAMIEAGLPFALASYGDGEWQAILGESGENCDGTIYEPELGKALADTLTSPTGQWFSFFDHENHIRHRALAWLRDTAPDLHWIAHRPWGRAADIGMAAPFFRACKTRDLVIVGPDHLEDLPEELLGDFTHVRIAPSAAWMDVDDICREVEDVHTVGAMVLFAAGMASNLAIHRIGLWNSITMIDIGSILDPYCGVMSRSIYRDADWIREMKPRNIP